MYFPFIGHYLNTRYLLEGVLPYDIIGYTIALCTLRIQRLLIDNIGNNINVTLVVAHKQHICCAGHKGLSSITHTIYTFNINHTI